jgi:hypothetical protein
MSGVTGGYPAGGVRAVAADGVAVITALRQSPASASAHTQARPVVWASAGELAPDRDIDAEHRAVIEASSPHASSTAATVRSARLANLCDTRTRRAPSKLDRLMSPDPTVPTEKGALPINTLRESTMVEA